jgi:AraC-like DNA-binding protein
MIFAARIAIRKSAIGCSGEVPRYIPGVDPRPIHYRRHDDGIDRWSVAEAPPAPALAGAVRGYSHYIEHTNSFTARREMPGTTGVLIINFGDPVELVGGDGEKLRLGAGQGFVAGLHTRPAISMSDRGRQSGIHVFLPLATLRRLLRLDMTDLVDRVVDLESVFGPGAATLGARLAEATPAACFSLMDAALAPRLAASATPDRATAWALARLHANPAIKIESLAGEIGWSRKHLAGRIRLQTGATPRLYARLRRLERLMAHLNNGTPPYWADLAAAHGFADQPHLAREVRDLSGLTPTMLLDRLLPNGGGIVEA